MTPRSYKILSVILVVAIFLGLHIYTAEQSPINFDEPVYLKAAIQYAEFIREGKYNWLAWNDYNYEHPVFYKIIYGVVLLTQPRLERTDPNEFRRIHPIQTAGERLWGMTGRYVSVFFSTLAGLVLALLNPLATLFLGLNTYTLLHTSTFYLEALPLLTSLLTAIFYLRWIDRESLSPGWKNLVWLSLSAGFLGMTAASKYTYVIVGIAISVHFLISLWEKKVKFTSLGWMAAWGVASLASFFICDPYLWPHPISRLVQSITFLADYNDANVVARNYPFWQPLLWFSAPYAAYYPEMKAAFLVQVDPLISLLALIGLPKLFKQKRFYFIWLVIGFGILMIWRIKWPQYVLIIMVPFSLSAALGTEWLFTLIWRWLQPRLSRAHP